MSKLCVVAVRSRLTLCGAEPVISSDSHSEPFLSRLWLCCFRQSLAAAGRESWQESSDLKHTVTVWVALGVVVVTMTVAFSLAVALSPA